MEVRRMVARFRHLAFGFVVVAALAGLAGCTPGGGGASPGADGSSAPQSQVAPGGY
jgi:hypothetical protein